MACAVVYLLVGLLFNDVVVSVQSLLCVWSWHKMRICLGYVTVDDSYVSRLKCVCACICSLLV